MVYTVGEMAKLLDIPASTLRYYDKEGLLPFVERSSGGIRMFRESDFEWLQVIGCMKKAGMSISIWILLPVFPMVHQRNSEVPLTMFTVFGRSSFSLVF